MEINSAKKLSGFFRALSTSLENAVLVAEKIRKCIAVRIRVAGEESFNVTVSIGVSNIDMLHKPNIEAAQIRAFNNLFKFL